MAGSHLANSHPAFSVVIATYNRDQQIIPTLESVRNQSFADFEVLVVSDGPPSATLTDVVEQFDSRFSLISLDRRTRSQSAPNNFGWERATGKYIAYLGHDDVWSANHLHLLATTFLAHGDADFAVSGCLYQGPPGTGDMFTWVSGLFDDKDVEAALKYFFPPSSISHSRDLRDRIPRWPDPMTTSLPVDSEFLIGAAKHKCKFVSTGEISVFKFASALRYLSYLYPDDFEQQETLRLMRDEVKFGAFVEDRVSASIANGGYMAPQHPVDEHYKLGQRLEVSEVRRGIALPETQALTEPVVLGVGDDDRSFDWYPTETRWGKRWRWSGPNLRPRLLLPYHSSSLVEIAIEIASFASDCLRESMQVFLNGRPVDIELVSIGESYLLSFVTLLNNAGPSVIEFRMTRKTGQVEVTGGTIDGRLLGMCFVRTRIRTI